MTEVLVTVSGNMGIVVIVQVRISYELVKVKVWIRFWFGCPQ